MNSPDPDKVLEHTEIQCLQCKQQESDFHGSDRGERGQPTTHDLERRRVYDLDRAQSRSGYTSRQLTSRKHYVYPSGFGRMGTDTSVEASGVMRHATGLPC
jgi:hypothetical protein